MQSGQIFIYFMSRTSYNMMR